MDNNIIIWLYHPLQPNQPWSIASTLKVATNLAFIIPVLAPMHAMCLLQACFDFSTYNDAVNLHLTDTLQVVWRCLSRSVRSIARGCATEMHVGPLHAVQLALGTAATMHVESLYVVPCMRDCSCDACQGIVCSAPFEKMQLQTHVKSLCEVQCMRRCNAGSLWLNHGFIPDLPGQHPFAVQHSRGSAAVHLGVLH